MSEVKWRLSETSEGQTVAVLVDGEIKMATDKDDRFGEILDLVRNGYEPSPELFDLTETVAQRFESLSERVAVANGRVYFDGDQIDNSLTEQVVRFVREGVDDWHPLVLFMEKLAQNPNGHSRDQLYAWMNGRNLTITKDGDFLAYKGVKVDSDGRYLSIHTGTAIVDGEVHRGHIPNYIGAVVEMPRSEVQHDPSNGCSVGLHAGTFGFASGFGQGATLTLRVNPRDVVSVPTDSNAQKLRVCRYVVEDVTETEYTEPVWYDDLDDDFDEYDEFGPEDAEDDDDDDDEYAQAVTDYGHVVTGWVTPAATHTTTATTAVNSQAKLDADAVRAIRDFAADGETTKRLSELYDVSERTIQRIVSREAWKDVA